MGKVSSCNPTWMDALMAKTLMQPEQNSEKKRSTHTVLCY
jgi:hypothetical protein